MPYIAKQIHFKSSDKKTTIRGIAYIPTNTTPKGVLQIAHGMCEHIGRYKKFMEYITSMGYIVCGHDHLGHGYSVADIGDLGYISSENGWKHLVNDCYNFTRIIKDMFFELPVYLMGHSMGSFVSKIYVAQHPCAVSGLILSGTSTGDKFLKAGEKLTYGVLKAKGHRHRSQRIQSLFFGRMLTAFPGETGLEWLSRDPQVWQEKITDVRSTYVLTTSAYMDVFRLIVEANRKEIYLHTSPVLPMYIIGGGADPVCNNGKDIIKVYEKYHKQGVLDIQYKIYPEFRHELTQEIGKEEVWQDIVQWLDRLEDMELQPVPC